MQLLIGGLALVAAALLGRWAWSRQRPIDLSAPDPGRARVTRADREAVARAVAAPTPAARIEGVLAAAILDGAPWREGLAQAVPDLDRLGASDDESALAAELLAWLGRREEAHRILETLPVDHWRGAAARSVSYLAAGDPERAENALVAATHLAPADRRPGLRARVDGHRRRHPRRRSEAERHWDDRDARDR